MNCFETEPNRESRIEVCTELNFVQRYTPPSY